MRDMVIDRVNGEGGEVLIEGRRRGWDEGGVVMGKGRGIGREKRRERKKRIEEDRKE